MIDLSELLPRPDPLANSVFRDFARRLGTLVRRKARARSGKRPVAAPGKRGPARRAMTGRRRSR